MQNQIRSCNKKEYEFEVPSALSPTSGVVAEAVKKPYL
jgi:hypothetical protein